MGVAGFGGIEQVKQVVRDLGTLLRGGFGGDDVEPAIELEGVGIDDLAIDLGCERERECGLAGGGGADEIEGGGRR